MEPISISLMALSASSVAIRHIGNEMSGANVLEFPVHRLDSKPRSTVLAALSSCIVKPRKLVEAGAKALADRLQGFATIHNLRLNAQVSLAALFDLEGEDTSAVATSLRQRRAEFVITAPDGTLLCGIELARRGKPGYSDAVRRRAFAQAGVPLVVLHTDADWAANRARLTEALDLSPEPANDGEAPELYEVLKVAMG